MKYFLVVFFAFFQFSAFAQVQDSVSNKSTIKTIWVDPIQILPREFSFYLDIENFDYLKGYMFGVIYPNKIFSDIMRSVHTASQLKFTNYGVLTGLNYDFGENDNVSFYTVGEYTWSNSVNIDRKSYITYEPHFGTVNINQREVSVHTRFEAAFPFGKQKVKHKIYLGLGFKIAYRYTFYNYYDDSYYYGYKVLKTKHPEEDDSWVKVTNDNGMYLLPKVYFGYRIGF